MNRRELERIGRVLNCGGEGGSPGPCKTTSEQLVQHKLVKNPSLIGGRTDAFQAFDVLHSESGKVLGHLVQENQTSYKYNKARKIVLGSSTSKKWTVKIPKENGGMSSERGYPNKDAAIKKIYDHHEMSQS